MGKEKQTDDSYHVFIKDATACIYSHFLTLVAPFFDDGKGKGKYTDGKRTEDAIHVDI